jgi:hypothetical protein
MERDDDYTGDAEKMRRPRVNWLVFFYWVVCTAGCALGAQRATDRVEIIAFVIAASLSVPLARFTAWWPRAISAPLLDYETVERLRLRLLGREETVWKSAAERRARASDR